MGKSQITIASDLADRLHSSDEESHVFAFFPKGRSMDEAEPAIDAVQRRYREEGDAAKHQGRFRGGWTWSRQGDVIAFNVLDPDGPLEVLQEFANDLADLGVAGEFGALANAPVAPLPDDSYLLEAVLHVGESVIRPDGKLGWRIDLRAYERALRHAAYWCTRDGQASQVIYKKSMLDPIRLDPSEDPVKRLLGELDPYDRTQLWTRDAAEDRFVSMEALYSRVSLIALLDPTVAGQKWRSAYEDLKRVVTGAGEVNGYAFIRHGTGNPSTSAGDNHWPWPPRPEWDSQPGANTAVLLRDDHLALDAFAFQALGPGYQEKDLRFPSYALERDPRTAFLEHRDLDAWFRAPFVPAEMLHKERTSVPAPPVLRGARAEMESILIKPSDVEGKQIHLDASSLFS
jgi:hypothetical protein